MAQRRRVENLLIYQKKKKQETLIYREILLKSLYHSKYVTLPP